MYEQVMQHKLFDPKELQLISEALGALLEHNMSAEDENATRALRTKTNALLKTIELLEPLSSTERLRIASLYLEEESVLAHAEQIMKQRMVDSQVIRPLAAQPSVSIE